MTTKNLEVNRGQWTEDREAKVLCIHLLAVVLIKEDGKNMAVYNKIFVK